MSRDDSDVLVVGGGPVGACAAQALAADGASVTLIEKEAEVCPPVERSARQLRPARAERRHAPGRARRARPGAALDARQLEPLLHRPAPQRRPSCAGSGCTAPPRRPRERGPRRPCCTPCTRPAPTCTTSWPATAASAGSITATASSRPTRRRRRWTRPRKRPRSARGLGVRADVLGPAEVRARFPGLRGEVAGALFFPDDGHMDPALFTRAMADRAAAARRRRCAAATEAIALEPAGAGAVKVVTTRGDFVADQVVLAAGAWTPALARGLGLALPIEPAKGYSVDVERPGRLPRAAAVPGRRPLRADAAGRRPAPRQHARARPAGT